MCKVSGTILSNTLGSRLLHLPFVDDSLVSTLTSSTYSLNDIGLTPEEQDVVLGAYMDGLHYVFIFYAVSAGLACIFSIGVGNTDLKSKKMKGDEEKNGREHEEDTRSGVLVGDESSTDTEEISDRVSGEKGQVNK